MKQQNRSAAVMQQRQDARDALNDFPTPPWATRALCQWLKSRGHQIGQCSVREPCANRGYMVAPLQEVFDRVDAADIHDYGVGYRVEDFLFGPLQDPVDWTIMNPPFRLAAQFIGRAIQTSVCGVAVFVRSAFLEGEQRYGSLFSQTPPSAILQFTERVVIHKGVMRRKGEKYVDAAGVERSASSATAYCWMVWEPGTIDGTGFHWIPPCSKTLEQPGDYDVRGTHAA